MKTFYKLSNITILVFIVVFNLLSQTPVLKVDINYADRKEGEVNEPGYIPWPVKAEGPKTLEGVTFEFKNGGITDSWYKTAVQTPYYARLANDGVLSEDVELHISGLQNGKHSLVTFHNTVGNPDNNIFSTINIYVNDVKVIDSLQPSNRVLSNDSCATAYMEFEVTNSDTVVIRFQSAPKTSTTSFGIPICGFHLNSSDPKKIARFQYPADMDEHVNIDTDTLIFYWTSPPNTVSHNIYLGTNKLEVITADTSSPHFIGNIADTFYVKTGFYNMDSYYWRVDPINSEGDTTQGDVWYFKKRIRAFPEAEGYGGYAIGGRGGKVVYVTNLEDYDPDNEEVIPGSFRDVVENDSGPRTILFTVSGLITLKDRLVIRDDYISVAGQTAPGKGVCFRWAPIGVVGDDLIVQNLRVRLGYGITYDGMGLTGANNSIVDHCSISWTIDEAFSSRGAKNITLQRTLISEALNMADHSNYGSGSEHGFAASIGGDIGSFHHNLLAHCNGRNWSLAGGLDGDGYYAGRLDLFNNVVYNWGYRATDGGAHEVNFVNNFYKKGVSTTQGIILNAQLEGVGKGTQSYYYAGNIVGHYSGTLICDGTDNTCSRTYSLSGGQILDWEVFVEDSFFPSEATIHSAEDAYKKVLSDVGCTQPVFDDHDKRIIEEALTGTYTYKGSRTGLKGFPDHEKDVGYWEDYPGFHRNVNWDSDLDGLPNWWEKAHGLDTNSTTDDFSESNADMDKNGYTNLEEYLHWMDRPHYFIKEEDSLKIDLKVYSKGFTNTPVFTINNITGGTATLNANDSIVEFIPDSNGLAGFDFTVTDAEGSTMSQKIGIFIGKIAADSAFTYTYSLSRPSDPVEPGDTTKPVNSGDTTTIIKNNINITDFSIFPNPVEHKMSIIFNSNKSGNVEFSVINLTGSKLINQKVHINQNTNTISLDLTKLLSGIYFLNVKNNELNRTFRFLKK